MAVGPCSRLSSIDTPASDAARLVRVFLTTAYVVSRPSARRRSVICLTVRPRYSVMTAAEADEKCSVSSATAVTFSVFGTCYLLSFSSGRSSGLWKGPQKAHGNEKRPGAGRTGRQGAEPSSLRGPLPTLRKAFDRTRACDDQRS